MKITYSKSQLEKVVDFLASNNQSFIGKNEVIREAIFKEMEILASDTELSYVGTMGFTLLSEYDEDEDEMMVDIIVDLSVSTDTFLEDDIESFETSEPVDETLN